MSKWREERQYEIMSNVMNDRNLKDFYENELKKSKSEFPKMEYFDRMEMCYEKAIKKHENIQR